MPGCGGCGGNCGVSTPPLAMSTETRLATQDGGLLRPLLQTPKPGLPEALARGGGGEAAAPTGRGAERNGRPSPTRSWRTRPLLDSGILILHIAGAGVSCGPASSSAPCQSCHSPVRSLVHPPIQASIHSFNSFYNVVLTEGPISARLYLMSEVQ